jgi:hypothetical protein
MDGANATRAFGGVQSILLARCRENLGVKGQKEIRREFVDGLIAVGRFYE